MIEHIEEIKVRYFNEWGGEVWPPHVEEQGAERVRISIIIDPPDDTHHIEIPIHESRYRLSGLLISLGNILAKGDVSR